ncbi:BRD4-interacting chromatin-remodeling complex-associated protein [Parasteatoda tepidariorum]|uniref:BRD4-interacting chromatin-remodeling complex-associated protein n=1 Tax=Parasteatoda tepidariorum TaxID=114398 RepID=UPI001C71C20B|nr:BRD4-interacting chromatin-remodeling complex-associated protein isoform X1 [Parasteatoda tepidariorum]
MDDGGRCLLDVINDPKLLQSFLESGSDDNSKDPQDGTSPESAVESPHLSKSSHSTLQNHLSNEHLVEQQDQMGFSYAIDGQALLAQGGISATTTGLGGMPLVVASAVTPQTYQHPSSSGATIHHLPSSITHTPLHPHSPASARSLTPLHNVKSPGPSSVHSMPPPSPLQQTRSPLPSHTPSPAPAWSPAPPVLSPASSRTQTAMPSVAFQQSHNQILQTSGSVTQFVTALANQQSVAPKLTLQQQQQLFLQQQLTPVSQHQVNQRLTAVSSAVATSTVSVNTPVVQLIPAQSNVTLSSRTSHCAVRPIQPKVPPQILPKPATCSANQFVTPTPAPKPTHTPVTTNQRTVGVGLQPGTPSQLVINQGQPGVFSSPSGTIVLNPIIPGVGQSPIVIQGNLGHLTNLPGSIQLTLRPQNSASPAQSMNSTNNQNNATLIAALQGPSQHTQTLFAPAKSPIHGQQTIVIPNNIAHAGLASQNINLSSAGIPNSGILSSTSQGQQFLRSNFILSPRVVGNHGIQFQQIQTPTGPIFFAPSQAIAVPHLQTATLGNAQLAPVTVPMHSVMAAGQGGVISGLSLQSHPPQSALQQQPQQSLFGTVPFSSHLEHSSPQVIQVPQPLAPPQQLPTNQTLQNHQIESSPKSNSPPKSSKIPSVNLEELLKEHGIVPTENSPLPSPDCNSPLMEDPPQQQSLVPSPHLVTTLQSQQIVLEQPQNHSTLGPLKVAVAQDGSVIIQSHNTISGPSRMQQHFVPSGQVHARTNCPVILPTVTSTASVPVVSTESTSSRNHSALIARLNAAPAITVPDVASLALSPGVGVSTNSSVTTTTITTTTTTLVPLSVQSLSVNNTPIVVQRTSFPGNFERVLLTEDIIVSHAPSVVTSTVQNRVNRTLVVPNEQRIQSIPKIIQNSHVNNVSSSSQNIQAELPKCTHKETPHAVKAVDNGAVVSSHNHSSISSSVPNQILPKLQKEITELLTLKYRGPELQKVLEQLATLQQKITGQNKGKGCRANQIQNQCKMEAEIEKLIQKSQQLQSVKVESSEPPPRPIQMKSHPIQQLEKQQQNTTMKPVNSNMNLVNLLKQGSSHSTPVVKPAPPPVTATTTVCDNTTASQSVVHSTVQKVNQIPVQRPVPTNNKTAPEIQPQVIVKLQKPAASLNAPVCTNVPKVIPHVKRTVINSVPKTVLISEQLAKDQNASLNPDLKTPFLSKADACRRLLSYHVYNSKLPSLAECDNADEAFEKATKQCFTNMKILRSKYHLLLLKESMRMCPTPDQVLMERLFIDDERAALQKDKALVAEGKNLSLPPPPSSWLQELKKSVEVKTESIKEEPVSEPDEPPEVSLDRPIKEDSDSLCKEDDNLEAPVIDSCADIVVPQNDDSCERSPPTLKRIVIQNEKFSESDSEEPPPPRKRLKYNSPKTEMYSSSNCKPQEPPSLSCEPENSFGRTADKKNSEKDFEIKTNNTYPLMTRQAFQSDDVVYEIRKELDMSPMEMDDDDDDEDVPHIVDFDTPSVANHLADFEPPVARTEESCDSNLLYNSSIRTNCAIKYDFDLLGSDWTEDYTHPQANETDLAVENIMVGHQSGASDLDLSGLDGLEEHLNDSRHCIPNGIQEDETSADSEPNFIGYRIPKHHKRFPGTSTMQNSSSSTRDQVQSAIKSIIGTPAESRSYFEGTDFLSLNRHSHNTHITDFGGVGGEVGFSSGSREPDLDEAVRSILL